MTHRTGPIGLALGAVLVALGLAAGVHASAQNTNGAQDSFMGRRGEARGDRGSLVPEGPSSVRSRCSHRSWG